MRNLRLAVIVAAACAAPARAADLDPLVPPDTQGYLAVNVRALLDSPLLKPLGGPLADLPGASEPEGRRVLEVLDDLGFDPRKDLDRVTFAMPGGDDTDRGLVIVRGKFNRAKIERRAAAAARDNAEAFKVHKVPLGGGATHTAWEVVIPNQDSSVFVALVDGRTLVASPGKDYVVDALKRQRAGKKAALANKDFQAVVERLDARHAVSLAVLGKALRGAVAELAPRAVTDALDGVEAVGGSLAVANDVRFGLVVAGKDAESAEAVRAALSRGLKLGMVGLALLAEDRKELGLLLEVVQSIKVRGKGKVVAVSGRLTADSVEDFFKKGD